MDLTVATAALAVALIGVAVTWLFAAWGLLTFAVVLLMAAVFVDFEGWVTD